MSNPFQRGWSFRLGHLRLRSVPWYWDVLRERLEEFSARTKPPAPPPAHHHHYCEECDRPWVHEGHTCAHPWASPCTEKSHHREGKGRHRLGSWLIVVRRDRTELSRHLGEGFGADPRVTVVLDRRHSDRRVLGARRMPGAVEQRRRSDRRRPHTSEDSSIWAGLGFRVLQAKPPDPR